MDKLKDQYDIDKTSGNYRHPAGVSYLWIEEEEIAGIIREMGRACWKQVRNLLTEKQ